MPPAAIAPRYTAYTGRETGKANKVIPASIAIATGLVRILTKKSAMPNTNPKPTPAIFRAMCFIEVTGSNKKININQPMATVASWGSQTINFIGSNEARTIKEASAAAGIIPLWAKMYKSIIKLLPKAPALPPVRMNLVKALNPRATLSPYEGIMPVQKIKNLVNKSLINHTVPHHLPNLLIYLNQPP